MKKFRKLIIFSLVLTGLGFLFKSFYMDAKAIAAQYLIKNAWEKSIETKIFYKPWPWADTKTVLKMHIPKLKKDIYILENSSGHSLAFGPGHSAESFMPGNNGTVLISAHRDTHFEFLKDMNLNDEIVLYDISSQEHRYRITNTKIIDTKTDNIGIYKGNEKLILITCWPFDSLESGGSKRYVVYFDKIELFSKF